MPVIERKLCIFLCHASQDKDVVRELYTKLLAEGWIDPWLDEKKLRPGQDWETEIEKAVESADAVIVLLSNSSVKKEGYIQKELRFALSIALEKPEDTIFIVPLRLDDCFVPRTMKSIQYVDYFPDSHHEFAYEHLRVSLEERANSIGVNVSEIKEKLRRDAEEKVRIENEKRIRKEVEEKILREEEAKIRQEAETRARKALERRIRKEAKEKLFLEEEIKQKESKKNQETSVDNLKKQKGITSANEPAGKSTVFEKDRNSKSKETKKIMQGQTKVVQKTTQNDKSLSKVLPQKSHSNGFLNSIMALFGNQPKSNLSKSDAKNNVEIQRNQPVFPKILTPRDQLKFRVRSSKPDSFISCPVCATEVKAKNMIKHYDGHGFISLPSVPNIREQFKQFAKLQKPDSSIECPICKSQVKARKLVLHYDRNHKFPL